MSNSDRLSETHKGKQLKSEESEQQESKVKIATLQVWKTLKDEFPDLDFIHEAHLSKQKISNALKLYFIKNGENTEFYQSNDRSHIKPDGGLLYVKIDGVWKLILSSEAKYQGSNDKRASKGLGKQSQGNVCERSHKNYNELALFTINENIFPYSIYLSGCDFEDGSSIRDRLTAMTMMCPINRIYLYDFGTHKRASIFLRKEQWSIEEIYEENLKIARGAMEYYLKNEERGVEMNNNETKDNVKKLVIRVLEEKIKAYQKEADILKTHIASLQNSNYKNTMGTANEAPFTPSRIPKTDDLKSERETSEPALIPQAATKEQILENMPLGKKMKGHEIRKAIKPLKILSEKRPTILKRMYNDGLLGRSGKGRKSLWWKIDQTTKGDQQ